MGGEALAEEDGAQWGNRIQNTEWKPVGSLQGRNALHSTQWIHSGPGYERSRGGEDRDRLNGSPVQFSGFSLSLSSAREFLGHDLQSAQMQSLQWTGTAPPLLTVATE